MKAKTKNAFNNLPLTLALVLAGSLTANCETRANDRTSPDGAPIQLTAKVVDCPVTGVTCVKLSAVNLSASQSMVVQGKKVTLATASGNVGAESQRAVYKMLGKKAVQSKRDAMVGTTIATAGLGTMIVSDAIDKKRGKQEWLGDEAKRRKSTDTLFEDRIVLPLDHTEGLLYFQISGSKLPRLRVSTTEWPRPEGQSSDACQFFEIPVSPDH